MGIDSVDRIVPTRAIDLPWACEIVGKCGMVFSVTVSTRTFAGNDAFVVIHDNETGVDIISDIDKNWDLLVPDSFDDPITQAEMVLALHNEGIDF